MNEGRSFDAHRSFLEQTDDVQASLVQDLKDIAANKKLKVNLRLKAIEMILSRRVPTQKSVEYKTAQQVNIFYMSPQEVAAARLSGLQTPLNDLAKEKRIELADLPPRLTAGGGFVENEPEPKPAEEVNETEEAEI